MNPKKPKAKTNKPRRVQRSLDSVVRLPDVLRVIDTEEECPGSPSPGCLAAFRAIMESRSDEAFAEAIRAGVRATKKSIRERMIRMANAPHHCLLPAGHEGRHFCHICGLYWDTPNAPADRPAIAGTVRPDVGGAR